MADAPGLEPVLRGVGSTPISRTVKKGENQLVFAFFSLARHTLGCTLLFLSFGAEDYGKKVVDIVGKLFVLAIDGMAVLAEGIHGSKMTNQKFELPGGQVFGDADEDVF